MYSGDRSARNGPSRANRHQGTGVSRQSFGTGALGAAGAHNISCMQKDFPPTAAATLCDPPPAARLENCPPQGRPALPLPANRPVSETSEYTRPIGDNDGEQSTPNGKHDTSTSIPPSSTGHENGENPGGGGRLVAGAEDTSSNGSPTCASMTSSSTTSRISGGDPGSGEHTDDAASPTWSLRRRMTRGVGSAASHGGLPPETVRRHSTRRRPRRRNGDPQVSELGDGHSPAHTR